MSPNSVLAKILRFLGIVFMALTGGFTLLGGVGTSCAAFNPLNPSWVDSMGPLARLQGLYIFYVLAGVALGLAGIWTVVLLVRGAPQAYRTALIVLLSGLVVGVIHMATSRWLRGKSMPVDAVVYTTAITLVLFLLFRLPGIWQGVDFTRGKGKSNQMAGGVAAIILGLLSLTISYTMSATHTWGGVNYAAAFEVTTTLLGAGSCLFGLALLLQPWIGSWLKVWQPARHYR